MKKISLSSQEQATGVVEARSSFQHISQINDHSLKLSDQVTKESYDLKLQSDDLHGIIKEIGSHFFGRREAS
ncbi:MAG: hypothetical protein KDD61_09750 [Bdellovibrionales bacterium]|nr:hypothetical protein [Bdellovibrionales bacterium]